MTKPTTPTRPEGLPPAAGGDVVEMDAMDVREWEQGQCTPQASDANLAALVRESTKAQEPVAPARPRTSSIVARAGGTGSVSTRPPRAGDTPATSGVPAKRPISRAEKVAPAAPRPTTSAFTARPAVPHEATVGTRPAPVKPGPALRSPPEPDAAPRSSRPLSPIRVGVARAGSSLDEARPSNLADQVAQSGAQPALDDADRTPTGPIPVAPVPAPILLPLPAPVELSPSPDPLAVPDRDTRPELPEPRARRERSATTELRGALTAASSRRMVLWIGAAAGCVALVVALVLVSRSKSGTVATSAQVEDHAPGAAAPARIAAAPAEPASPTPAPAAPDPPAVQAPPAPPPQPRVPAIRSAQRPARKLGGKKLVVEYTGRENEVAAPGLSAQTTEDPAIARARAAYVSGNQKLFAGDAQGAVRAYRQALGFYPGYVGGYRGLGLAYAQLGDSFKALDAFKTYVSVVPGAKDIALIKKRIARLPAK